VYVDREQEAFDITSPMRPPSMSFAAPDEEEAREPVIPGRTVYEDQTTVQEELQVARAVGNAFMDLLGSVQRDLRQHAVLDAERIKGALLDMVDSVIRNPNAMRLLMTLREKDPNSVAYSLNVAITLVAFGRHLGCPRDQLEHLGLGGLLLDIGKLRLPEALLAKKTALSGEEHRLLKAHVDLGVAILCSTPGIPPEVAAMVAAHHEREDGSGYPRGLKGREIGLLGKIAAIVDCFEELTTERFLAPAASPQEALQMLQQWRVRLFDAWLVDQFVQFMGLYPVGSLVELRTAEVAVILANRSGDGSGPIIMLILDPERKAYADRAVIDLSAPAADGPRREIRRGLEPGTYGINPRAYLPDA
jgi:HD-GYP domain-containing protein (c-di-GMP phosphodiesterase class II)